MFSRTTFRFPGIRSPRGSLLPGYINNIKKLKEPICTNNTPVIAKIALVKIGRLKKKDMDFAIEVLLDIVCSSMPKYADYDTKKAVARKLISAWVAKLFNVLPEHYESIEMQHEILFNILLTLVEVYPDDGLPRKALNKLIAELSFNKAAQ